MYAWMLGKIAAIYIEITSINPIVYIVFGLLMIIFLMEKEENN